MSDRVRWFVELTPKQQPFAGGKGGTLARLYQTGYPVPDGFVILPTAFTDDEIIREAIHTAHQSRHSERVRVQRG